MKKHMNKYKLFMIISVCILIITIGTTFALYVWESTTNAIVRLDVCTPTVYFSGGKEINGKNLIPVFNKEDGVKKEIEVRLNKSCDTVVTMNLYMKLDVLSSGLSDETFVYELYKGNALITSGNFAGKKEGDTLEIANNEVISETSSVYMLYIYLDGNQDNPDTTQNQRFKFSLYSEGTGAIYKENVMEGYTNPTSSDSTFLNTTIKRKEVQRVSFVKDNNVPEGVIESVDISSKQDESVMLWYKDEDNDNLYEVYIGGKNGVVKANTSCYRMFAFLENVEYLDLSNLDTSNVTTMFGMFYGCSNLTDLNISNLDTSNVVDMSWMFFECTSLESLNLDNFDTTELTRLYATFSGMRKLKSLDLSSFDTSKVTNMIMIFSGCGNLTALNLSNFNTSKVTDMSTMFFGCSSLTSLDLSSFDTSKVTKMGNMFNGCANLKSLDLNSFDTQNVTEMSRMFKNCNSLTNLDLTSFDTSKVTNMYQMFFGSGSLKSIDLTSFNTSNVTNMNGMFGKLWIIEKLDLSSFNTSKVTDISSMFYGCYELKTIDLRNADFSNIPNFGDMLGLDGYRVPYTSTIYVKDSVQKELLTSKFPNYTNIIIP